jgi:hypothetical protein
VALAVAAVAQPLILLAIGSDLTALAWGLAGVNVALAVVMLGLTLPRRPRSGGGAPGRDDEALVVEAA